MEEPQSPYYFITNDIFESGVKQYELGRFEIALWHFKTSSEKYNNHTAQYYLGLMHEKGEGTSVNLEESLVWYTKAAQGGHNIAQFCVGEFYEYGLGINQDYIQALVWYRRSADNGCAAAECSIGALYERGHGVTQDYSQALLWYKRAADKGYAIAQYNIGDMYQYGKGVFLQNYDQALSWYMKAAERDHAEAQYQVGMFYRNGYGGTKRDGYKALFWLEKSSENGSKLASFVAEVLYRKKSTNMQNDDDDAYALLMHIKQMQPVHFDLQANIGTTLDLLYGPAGVSLDYMTAANRGDPDAQNNVGVLCYDRNNNNKKSSSPNYNSDEPYDSSFLDWFTKAAGNGSALAQYNIGLLYHYGYGRVGLDVKKALYWFEKASKNENNRNGYADYHIGTIYQNGIGVPKDSQKALYYYIKPASMSTEAYTHIGDLQKYGYGGLKPDYEEAFKWYSKSAMAGDCIGKLDLGVMYLYGLGVSANYELALDFFRNSILNGDFDIIAAQYFINEANRKNASKKLQQQQNEPFGTEEVKPANRRREDIHSSTSSTSTISIEEMNKRLQTIQEQVEHESKEKENMISTLLQQLKLQQSQIESLVGLLSNKNGADNTTAAAAASPTPADIAAAILSPERETTHLNIANQQQKESKKFFSVGDNYAQQVKSDDQIKFLHVEDQSEKKTSSSIKFFHV